MRPSVIYRLLGPWLSIVLLIGGLGLVDAAWATEQKQVLVLHATRRDAQLSVLGDRELPRILEQGLGQSLDYHTEYLDLSRFPDPGYRTALGDFLRLKYKAQRFDLVIAMHDIVLEFLTANRSTLFPGAPVVFFSTSTETQRIANSTGIIAGPDFGGTLALAAELHPELRRVIVVTGADSRDKEFEGLARAQFRPFEQRLAFTYMTGLTTRDLETRLATLPENSIIYYLVVNRDGAGGNFHPLEYLDRIAAVANAPIYCWVDSAMDHGIVGGSLKNQLRQTGAVGQLALRVLRGEPADSIPIASPDLNVSQVDWRQLRRWGISAARVPSGALIMFREPSAWDRYSIYILAAAAMLIAQTALITGLLVQRARRRQAEQQVRGSQAELRRSYERIRDLGGRLLSAQDSERARIARELHDDISQQVALLAIDLELLGRVAAGDSEPLLGECLNRAHVIARSVHDLSHRLHPAKLRLIGLVPALDALQRELSRSGIRIGFLHETVPPLLPPDLTLCVYRIVQEALQNVLKHSKARDVSVHLRGGPEGLALTILDDGVGFDPDVSWSKGLGLVSIRERLEAIGGTIEVDSSPGAGTRLLITIPLQARSLNAAALSSGAALDESLRPSLAGEAPVARADFA
jgi:signal transduction histidine kinase